MSKRVESPKHLNSLPEAVVRNMQKYLTLNDIHSYGTINRQAQIDSKYKLDKLKDTDFIIKEVNKKLKHVIPNLDKNLIRNSVYGLNNHVMRGKRNEIAFELKSEIIEQSESRNGDYTIEFQNLYYDFTHRMINVQTNEYLYGPGSRFELSSKHYINEDQDLDFYFRVLRRPIN